MSYFSESSPDCSNCSLSLFCSYDKLKGVVLKHRHLKRREVLHFANDTFINLYAIQSGALKTHETDLMGNELIRELYVKNEVYGYEAIYKGYYPFSATALTDTIVCEMSYQHFLELIRTEPPLLQRTMYLISQRLNAGSYVKLITAQQRLSAFLIDLSTRLTLEVPAHFLLPMSYQDIGHYIGLATETVSRVFSKLVKNNIISIENKHIYIHQLNILQQFAEGK